MSLTLPHDKWDPSKCLPLYGGTSQASRFLLNTCSGAEVSSPMLRNPPAFSRLCLPSHEVCQTSTTQYEGFLIMMFAPWWCRWSESSVSSQLPRTFEVLFAFGILKVFSPATEILVKTSVKLVFFVSVDLPLWS